MLHLYDILPTGIGGGTSCANWKYKMPNSCDLRFRTRFSARRSLAMTIGYTGFCLSAPVSVVRRWRSFWGKAVARFNIGFGDSNGAGLPGCRRASEQGVHLRWMKKPWKRLGETWGGPLVLGGTPRICGTESFSVITWLSGTAPN